MNETENNSTVSMDAVPRLTIVMPCFNRTEMVKFMIDSIISNDYSDWELVVVDDGSEADTLALLDGYQQSDARIRFLRRPAEAQKGAQTCRNMGMSVARGEYLIFFDSDDYVLPYCLGQRVSMLDKRADLDFMVFPSAVYLDGKVVTDHKRSMFGYKVADDDLAAFASRNLPFVVCNNIYRVKALRQNDLQWDTNLRSLQDADFNMRAILCGLKYDYAHVKPDYAYRISGNPTSVSANIASDSHFESVLYALERFYKMLQGRFGRRYDKALFDGVLLMFTKLFSSGVNPVQAKRMHAVLSQYDRPRFAMLWMQVQLSRMFSLFMPAKRARQLVTFAYLLRRKKRWDAIHRCIIQQQADL